MSVFQDALFRNPLSVLVQVAKKEFLEAMAALGWDGDAYRMYQLLDFDKSGFVTLEEIDEKAYAAYGGPLEDQF